MLTVHSMHGPNNYNLNSNKKIKPLLFKSKTTNTLVEHKASGYADYIAIVCKSNLQSVQDVFRKYERLTEKSGLELNADKTEILRIGHLNNKELIFLDNYLEKVYDVKNVKTIIY